MDVKWQKKLIEATKRNLKKIPGCIVSIQQLDRLKEELRVWQNEQKGKRG